MVPAAIVARELGMRVIDTSSVTSYVGGEDLLMIGDLADTGATVKLIRAVIGGRKRL